MPDHPALHLAPEDEYRMLVGLVELRANDDGERLEGYAAVFNKPTQIGGDQWGWREQIAAGAFTQAIAEDDVRALFNHDANVVLGRNTTKTLTLSEDKKGLRASILPPETAAARDVLTLVKRGDVSGMSFAFRVRKETWEEPKKKGELPLRTLQDLRLFDVSVVTYPAYPQTSVSARDQARTYQEALDRLVRDADGDRIRQLRLHQAAAFSGARR